MDGITITVNVAGTDQFIRFMDRLELIANRAPADVRRDIESAVAQLLAELEQGKPHG